MNVTVTAPSVNAQEPEENYSTPQSDRVIFVSARLFLYEVEKNRRVENLTAAFIEKMEVEIGSSFNQARKWTEGKLWRAKQGPLDNRTEAPLQEWHVRQHLSGKDPVAVPRPINKRTRLLSIDLDAHDKSKDDVWDRVDGVKGAFPSINWALIQSSNSGGIHMYAFFEESYDPALIIPEIEQTLWNAGLQVTPGVVEVYPDLLSGNYLRLPLGPGSFILDPNTRQRKNKTKLQDIQELISTDNSDSLEDYLLSIDGRTFYEEDLNLDRFLILDVFDDGDKFEKIHHFIKSGKTLSLDNLFCAGLISPKELAGVAV